MKTFLEIFKSQAQARFDRGYKLGQTINIEEAELEIQSALDFGDYDEFDKGLEKAIEERKKKAVE
jgi:hypothetical protein